MIVTHDRARALETLRIVDPLLNKRPVPEHQLIAQIRQIGNHYNWLSGTPPELKEDLKYLHGICGLQQFPDRMYTRDKLTNYLLGRT